MTGLLPYKDVVQTETIIQYIYSFIDCYFREKIGK